MNWNKILTHKSLLGRVLLEDEELELKKQFDKELLPDFILKMEKKFAIIGQYIVLSESEDFSKVGVQMEWLTPQEMIEEAFDYFPGLIAKEYGFLPIGKCLLGSGDPYFLKELTVYRIRHDSIVNFKYIDQKGIEIISSLDYIFKRGITSSNAEDSNNV